MKKYYIIEFPMEEKELNEMDALELDNIDQAIDWIQGSMDSDEEYFNIHLNCNIDILKYEQYGSDLDFYCKALVSVDFDSIVTEEMFASNVYSAETIIEENLSVISRITHKLIEVSE